MATKPGSWVYFELCVLLFTMTSFMFCYFYVLFVYSVSWLFLLGCQYQCK